MKILSFFKALIAGAFVYFLLHWLSLALSNPYWLELLYGSDIFKNAEIVHSFQNITTLLHPSLNWIFSIGVGILVFLFDGLFKGKLLWLKAIVSISFISLLFGQGFNFYFASDQLLADIESFKQKNLVEEIVVEQSYPNIIVEADEEVYARDIQEIEKALKSMPDFLVKHCKNIYIMDASQYEKAGKELKMENPLETAAFSYSGDMSIRIRILQDPNVANTYTHTMVHELCHIYDFLYGNDKDPSGLSTLETFKELYREAPDSISEYGASNEYEFFAEAGGLYITDPNQLYQLNPDVYDYFDQLFGPNIHTT